MSSARLSGSTLMHSSKYAAIGLLVLLLLCLIVCASVRQKVTVSYHWMMIRRLLTSDPDLRRRLLEKVESRKQLIRQHQTLEAKIKLLEDKTKLLEARWRNVKTGFEDEEGGAAGGQLKRDNLRRAKKKAWRKWRLKEQELIELKKEGEDGAYEELYDGRMVSMDV